MALKALLEKLDDLPEPIREHYTEVKDKEGKTTGYVLGIDESDKHPLVKGLKTEAGEYRIKLREAEGKYGKLKGFEGMDHAEVLAKLDRITELETAAGGKLDEKAIDAIVEGRIKTKTGPLERQLTALTAERDTLKAANDQMTTKERTRLISDAVREAATKLKMQPEAVDDAIMYGERIFEVDEDGKVTVKDKVGFTPGIDAASWLSDMQQKKPHWWGPSQGGGSKGGGNFGGGFGKNPWTHENWNVTEQNRLINADGVRAKSMAEAAGTKLGGTKPKPQK